MQKRGWTPEQIDEAIDRGEKFKAENLINKDHSATFVPRHCLTSQKTGARKLS